VETGILTLDSKVNKTADLIAGIYGGRPNGGGGGGGRGRGRVGWVES